MEILESLAREPATLVLGLVALVAIIALAKTRRAAAPVPEAAALGSRAPESELVAVISAAVAAAGGMAPGSFRVAGIEPIGNTGFNTPAWGYADRFGRNSHSR